MEIFLYLLPCIIWCLIWGFATRAVIHNKGYDNNWFWWGFFFGVIAFIVALTKKDITYEQYYYQKNKPELNYQSAQSATSSKTWQCACGEINLDYVTTCPECGRRKSSAVGASSRSYSSNNNSAKVPAPDWRCSCGAMNKGYEKECHRCHKSIYDKDKKSDDTVNELKKLKELLDSGIITQEEFDKKKKEYLNL